MILEDLPSGHSVLIDANIFIHHFTGTSPDCSRLLERCAVADLNGLTTAHVVLETAHRLMLLEAVVRDITQRGDVARQLGERPEAVMQLTEYGRQIMTISEMGISILPVSFGLWAAGIRYQQCYGLLTNDSVVIAACIENNCHNLASGDAAFRKVREIQLYEPSDIG